MSATYTFDVFMSLDGFGSYDEPGDWGGYWGKQGPELLARREELYAEPVRMVFGATTFADFQRMLATEPPGSEVFDTWVGRMHAMPATVMSATMTDTGSWPQATIEARDAVAAVRRLKEESDVPLLSHGSLSLNRALMAAGVVDRVQVTVFPVVTGLSGTAPVFGGAADFDLDLLDSRVLDGRSHQLTYRPTLRRGRD